MVISTGPPSERVQLLTLKPGASAVGLVPIATLPGHLNRITTDPSVKYEAAGVESSLLINSLNWRALISISDCDSCFIPIALAHTLPLQIVTSHFSNRFPGGAQGFKNLTNSMLIVSPLSAMDSHVSTLPLLVIKQSSHAGSNISF